jgi:hypothetical protein
MDDFVEAAIMSSSPQREYRLMLCIACHTCNAQLTIIFVLHAMCVFPVLYVHVPILVLLDSIIL